MSTTPTPEPLSEETLARLEELHAKATPGPWERDIEPEFRGFEGREPTYCRGVKSVAGIIVRFDDDYGRRLPKGGSPR